MRVIAGSARSLPLKTVPSDAVRPTTDKTKETLFNILMPRIGGCRFLDLFSGSGAIGIEALSRGAAFCALVEKDRTAQKVIEDNLAFTHLKEGAELVRGDVLFALKKLEGKGAFDIIFMDPPYRKGLEERVLRELKDSSLADEDTIIVVEAANETGFDYLDSLGYVCYKEKRYKTNKHLFIKRNHGKED